MAFKDSACFLHTSTCPHLRGFLLWIIVIFAVFGVSHAASAQEERSDWDPLHREATRLGKPGWRAMLQYAVALHERSTHSPAPPFAYEWEEIGPGYGYGPAFGHWDVVHEILDVMPTGIEHARHQLLNNVRLQLENGFLPGVIWMPGAPASVNGKPTFNTGTQSHPPVWVVAADDYMRYSRSTELLKEFYQRLTKQINWFEKNRKAQPDGFFYNDILIHKWESGVDEGVRFDGTQQGPLACIDATSHVYQLYAFAANWAAQLGRGEAVVWRRKAEHLKRFIQRELYDPRSGYFYDIWAMRDPAARHLAYEGLWPVIVGAATPAQANRITTEFVLNPKRFFTKHPIPTVAVEDPKFELRMWRGPSWNSMTYWVARGLLRYGHRDAARKLLEAALDDSAEWFARTGTIWEFYHPHGGDPRQLQRKPQTKRNLPWTDYLGHNPLLAMARMYEELSASGPRPRTAARY